MLHVDEASVVNIIFCDEIFKCNFLNENVWIPNKISLKFVPKVQLTIFQHRFWSKLGTYQATSYYLNRWWLDYWCIYVSLGPYEFTTSDQVSNMASDFLAALENGCQLAVFSKRNFLVKSTLVYFAHSVTHLAEYFGEHCVWFMVICSSVHILFSHWVWVNLH